MVLLKLFFFRIASISNRNLQQLKVEIKAAAFTCPRLFLQETATKLDYYLQHQQEIDATFSLQEIFLLFFLSRLALAR